MTLYIVATPIGNLEDITLRAVRILKEVDLIVCEDTRHTRKLLTHFDIHTPLASFFEHKEESKLNPLLAKLVEGKNLALVSDAGTPGISDPGFRLIRAAVAKQIPVVPLPGACAAITALQGSGFPTDHFFFAGFLPEKPGKRQKYIESLKTFPHTIIFYLSPWKAAKQLQELSQILGERQVCMAREITKIHEEFWRGSLIELTEKICAKPPKGEITLIVSGMALEIVLENEE
ncbi:MAG: 16S rRNA (cytidine(1402)-2'-O)-methyltransferase [Deltaproteobacteria bacterium]|nr:16S rRNA (cytidine(1402)-2'-O)-methyltransferase [Deltaproteobacteria bacterium]